jgi:hypothetical protein
MGTYQMRTQRKFAWRPIWCEIHDFRAKRWFCFYWRVQTRCLGCVHWKTETRYRCRDRAIAQIDEQKPADIDLKPTVHGTRSMKVKLVRRGKAKVEYLDDEQKEANDE